MLALFSNVDKDRCFLRRAAFELLLLTEILGSGADDMPGVGEGGLVGTVGGASTGSSGSKNV